MIDVLHYRGDHTAFDPDVTMGPDWGGGCWAVKSATYDTDADLTTLALRPLPRAELLARAEAVHGRMQMPQRLRLATLFGGRL